MKSNKKGFTLLELIVVIAVIAILAAILIPTFSKIIKNSKVSVDGNLIRNLNTALATDSVLNGKHNTMTDALAAAEKAGYNVGKINKSATDNEILWDSKNDVFCYYNNDSKAGSEIGKIEYIPKTTLKYEKNEGSTYNPEKVNLVDYWVIASAPSDKGYSTYLYQSTESSYTVTTGLDVGNETVTSIEYNRDGSAQTVVIRTHGGILTVNAPADTVKHYGDAAVLNIEEIAPSSYHEFGTVANAQIKTGRIVIENSKAAIDNLLLIAKTDKSGFEKIVVETKTGAELPTFDRTDVIIAENGTLVLNVVTPSTDEYIYLTKAGVIEQIVVTDEETNVSGLASNVASKSEKTQKVASQIANIGAKDEDGNYVDSNGDAVALENLNNVSQIVIKDKGSEETVQIGLTTFTGGAGTVSSPYLISKGSQFKAITGDLTDKCFKIINDIDVAESDFTEKYLIGDFSGSLDGGNHRVKFPYYATKDGHYLINNFSGTLQNIEVEFDNFGAIVYSASTNVSFTNVDVYGIIFCDNNYGAYILVDNAPQITFTGCDFYGTISAGGSKDNNNAIYVGQTNTANFEERSLSFDNCHNYGSIMSGDAVMFIANVVKYNQDTGKDAYVTIDINHCTNEGLVQWIENTGYRPYNHFASTSIHMVKEITINGVKYVKTVNLTEDQIAALNIDGINVIAMDQENTSDGKKLVKHTSPTMPDANGRNYVVSIADSTLKIYVLEDGTFKVNKATASNVAYYEVTNQTMVHYNGASQLYIITERIDSGDFSGNTYTTTMKNYTFLDDTYISKNASYQGGEFGTITISGVDYPTYTVNGETHYYYHDEHFYFAGDMYKNKAGSVYVSAYDSEGVIIASAPLTDAPAAEIRNLVLEAKNGLNLDQLYVDSVDTADGTADGWRRYYYASGSNSATGYDNARNQDFSNTYVTGFIEIQRDSNNNPIYTYYLKTKANLSSDRERILVATGTTTSNNVTKVTSVKSVKFNSLAVTRTAADANGYYIYTINLNELFPNEANILYFKLSVDISGGNTSIIYCD